jgi:lipoate-protein ligase A
MKESKSKLTGLDKDKQMSDEEFREKYNSTLKERLDNLDDDDYDNDYDQFSEYLKPELQNVHEKKKCPG